MNTKYLRLLLPLVFILVSCQAANTPFKATPQKATESQTKSWEAELSVTGGIAGVQKGIKIASTGEVILSDANRSLELQERLSEEEIEKFTRLVTSIKDVKVASNPPACADCFQYQLNVSVDGTQIQATVNDLNLPNSGIAPLISEMITLMENSIQ